NGRGVLERIEAAGSEVARERHLVGERRAGKSRDVRWNRVSAMTAQELRDRLADDLAEEIPKRNVDARDGVDVEAAEVSAHAHEVVQVFLDRDGVARIASGHLRAE